VEILASNFDPLALSSRTFVSRWEELFQSAKAVKIGIGYASNDSILYLKKLIELNQPKSLELCLGMAYFEGLTKSQFEATLELNKLLTTKKIGKVNIARAFPFHGKIQYFQSATVKDTFLLGSSNLSNIVPLKGITRRNYEVDIEITDPSCCVEIGNLLDGLFTDASVTFETISKEIQIKENQNTLLSTRSDVQEVGDEKIDKVISHLLPNSFEIPLKDAPKSNLNAYFGEGRVNQQGFVKPRHWYEVEIIVDQSVQRSAKNYPANQDFIAYTDDGHRFVMRTSGDYGKNLRSKDDLTILGRWIKGRMEANGALKSGELLTSSSLGLYGRDTITLTQTSLYEEELENGNLSVWYVDFSAGNKAI
jgi:hypothetical protein